MRSGEQTVKPGSANKAASEAARAALAAQFELARRHCAAGRFAAAENLCRQMLKTAPGNLKVILTLGEALSSQGRHRDAIGVLAPLVEQRPNDGSVHFCLGNALHAAGRYAEAAQHLRRTTALQPRFAGGHCNLGLALEKLGDYAGAARACARALSLQPNLWQARANLGITLLNLGKAEDAVVQLRRAAALNPADSSTYYFLGRALEKTGKMAEALTCHERVVALEPNLPRGWLGLGAALRVLGRFAEAAAAFEKALALNPDLGMAHHALTTLRQEMADAGELDRLRRIVASAEAGVAGRRDAGMALAKMLEHFGHYDEAFAALVEANRLARAEQLAANIRYDHDDFRAKIDALRRVFTPEFFAATSGWGNPSELPVFIVGSFRTGSTLVEQICASHSQVHGAGELADIVQIAAEIQRTPPQRWTQGLFRPLADRHVQRLAALAPGKSRVIDKTLDNTYRLGLIAAMFPRARVIVTHRDGRDAALSVLMHDFDQHISFATDLIDAGRRWHEAERMSAYWARCLPLAMHHVQYETLIGDFETEARKLIEFLGLAWEPACLEFHKTERAVRTASAWQVRQPLYDSSVGRWRNYAKHLAPLCAAIGIDPQASTGTRPAGIA